MSLSFNIPIANSRRAFHPMRAARLSLLVLPLALSALGGCAEKWAEVFPVSGTVKVDGQAPTGAQIALYAVAPAGSDAVTPTGAVKNDGSFVISSYKAGDGAPPGEYVATIQWFKFDEKISGAGPNVLPELYANPKTSPIKVKVGSGGPTVIDPISIKAEKTARGPAATSSK
jgi:hypothetical protein